MVHLIYVKIICNFIRKYQYSHEQKSKRKTIHQKRNSSRKQKYTKEEKNEMPLVINQVKTLKSLRVVKAVK